MILLVRNVLAFKMVCLKKRHGKFCIKFTFWFVLLCCYMKFYFMEQFFELLSGRTAFSGKIEKVDEMPIPTLTFCMKPYFKPSISEKYDFSKLQLGRMGSMG